MKSIHDFYEESPTKQKTREKIIQTAMLHFIDRGIDLVTMKEIAKAGGLTPRNLTRYYPGKEYLVVDVAYEIIWASDMIESFMPPEEMLGIEQLEMYLKKIFLSETVDGAAALLGRDASEVLGFIMYFDLYLARMPKDHPAFHRYTECYVKEINEVDYDVVRQIIGKGIEDGSINKGEYAVEALCHNIMQSLVGVATRAVLKSYEDKRFNLSLVRWHIDMIVNQLANNKKEKDHEEEN